MIPKNEIDPRAQRTHQLLLQTFTTLMKEKDIRKISVQDIVQRARVHRATFYAHFGDKYELIDSWLQEDFQQALRDALPRSSTLSTSSLHTLILTVFTFLGELHSHCKPPERAMDRQFESLFEAVIQQEIAAILLTWLKQLPITRRQQLEPLETTSLILSWTIFGPAVQWSRGTRTPSAAKMARHVTQLATGYLSNVMDTSML